MLQSSNGLQAAFTTTVYLMVGLSTCSTKECILQLTEKIKSRSVVFRNVDLKLCQAKCIEDAVIFASCRRSGEESKEIENSEGLSVHPENHAEVSTKSCGSTVCNESSLCLDEGCRRVCVEAPPLCDLHTASKAGDLSRVKLLLSQGRVLINCQEWIGRTPVMWAATGRHREVVELLIGKGADLTLVDRFGINILHSACLGGVVEVVKFVLLQNILGINGRVRCGRTAVMLAAESGHKEVVELLVDKGADVSLVDEAGDNVLHCACRGANEEMVQYILSNTMVDIDSRGYNDKTPLMIAGQSGHKGVVDLLVQNGANLLLKDKRGDNILHLACWEGHLDVVEYIISLHRVDINSVGFEKKTPVMLAGQGGHKEVVELLVNHGANLALRNSDYSNILHLTSYGGYVDVMKYVLSQSAVDVDSRGWKKSTAVMIAGMKGYKELVELFVEHGAQLSLTDKVGNNILYYASARGHLEVVKYIISLHKVDINSRGEEKRTSVMIAGNCGHEKVVEFLVKHGANLLLRNRVGDNILHLACKKGRLDVVKYIISLHKIDIDGGGFEKTTPVMLAGQRGHKKVVELLVNHGANLALRNSDYSNILHLTSYGGYVDVMKYVLSQSAVDIDSRGWKRRTAVMIAGMKGYKELVELFVEHGAQLSLTDRVGNNILLLAVPHLEVVKYILSLGVVNINAKNRKGKSAAMKARAQGRRDVLDILVSHGAHT